MHPCVGDCLKPMAMTDEAAAKIRNLNWSGFHFNVDLKFSFETFQTFCFANLKYFRSIVFHICEVFVHEWYCLILTRTVCGFTESKMAQDFIL